jgi:hypothetical protein
MYGVSHRVLLTAALFCAAAVSMSAATLEKLSLEDMARKSTAVVRARVSACQGEAQGSVILTRCRVQVSEVWKGALADSTFYVPGGRANGLVQTFNGAPRVTEGQEYVLFLWAGRSGKPQIIGLSQGAFDLSTDAKGVVRARRSASTESMLDSSGVPVNDSAVEMSVAELKSRVQKALEVSAR